MPRSRGTQKRPKVGAAPVTGKEVRAARDPSGYDDETIVWRFSVVDVGGQWGWRTMGGPTWWNNVFPKLKDFESMTWAEIQRASGGRSRGNNSHPVKVANLSRAAKNRLAELHQEDTDELFSLRLSGNQRIYGIRDRRALKLLWYDSNHGDNSRAVYPVGGR